MFKFKSILQGTASAVAIGASATTLLSMSAQELEQDQYSLLMTTQVFDGVQEMSHMQTAGLARIRNGDESYVQIDFHNGSVAVERENSLDFANIRNESDQEAAFLYNFASHTLSGGNDISDDFNRYIRPLMSGNVALGQDANWVKRVRLDQLGIEGVWDGEVEIQLTRKYFTHDQQDLVLITYTLPAFEYVAPDGSPVIHWGQSAALLDAKMARAYWNTTLHNAIAGEELDQTRPFRFHKMIAMKDDKGQPVLNVRDIPQVWPTFESYYSWAATGPLPFVDSDLALDTPLEVAVQLDILGLSLAENSGNQLGELTAQHQNGNRGKEAADESATDIGYATKAGTAVKLSVSKEEVTAYLIAERDDLTRDWASIEQRSKSVATQSVEAAREFQIAEQANIKIIDELSDLSLANKDDLRKIEQLSARTAGVSMNNLDLRPSQYNDLVELAELEKAVKARSAEMEIVERAAVKIQSDFTTAKVNLKRLSNQMDGLLEEASKLASRAAEWKANAQLTGNLRITAGSFVEKLPASVQSVLNKETGKLVTEFGGELLTTAGDVANIYTTAKGGYNSRGVIAGAAKEMGRRSFVHKMPIQYFHEDRLLASSWIR